MGNPVVAIQSSPLTELQKKYCIVDIAGEIRLMDLEQISDVQNGIFTGELAVYKKHDGALVMHRFLEQIPVPSKPKEVINDFWVSPKTVLFDQIAFSPLPAPSSTLNYWVGHTVVPVDGNWSVLKKYLFHVICNSEAMTFSYLLRYLAHMLQKPQEKPGVMPILLGGQGVGKGVFFKLLNAIWGSTTLQVYEVDQVVGRFNAALERNYVVCMDEALFKGDKKARDRLKSLVTEPTIRIEQKYQPSRSITSVHRFFAASNYDQILEVERDDRRFFFLEVSDAYKQNNEYFKRICDAINDKNAIGALVKCLLRLNLTSFNVRKKPSNQKQTEQKLISLSGFSRYWYEVLSTGNFYCAGIVMNSWVDSIFMSTEALKQNYKEFDKQVGRYEPVQATVVARKINELCPSAKHDRKQVNNIQQRGFTLPDLYTARKEFEVYVGSEIGWDD